MARQEITLGQIKMGPGHPPVYWPDIDVYFKKDLNLAFKLVEQIAAAGGKFLKGALLHDPAICVESHLLAKYYHPQTGFVEEPYHKIIARHVVPLATHKKIYQRAKELGLELVLSVYDQQGVEFAVTIGACAVKIPSSNIVHLPLIKMVAQTGLPVVIDTGRSTLAEIDRAVAYAKANGAHNLIVQHSPPGPPNPPSLFNLPQLTAIHERYDCLSGLSDHYTGIEMVLVAAALGVEVIEKGLCADEVTPDIDVAHALKISQLQPLLDKISTVYQAMQWAPLAAPAERPRDRMGLVANMNLAKGARLSLANTRFAFPTVGIPVEEWDEVAGRALTTAVSAGTPLTREMVERDG